MPVTNAEGFTYEGPNSVSNTSGQVIVRGFPKTYVMFGTFNNDTIGASYGIMGHIRAESPGQTIRALQSEFGLQQLTIGGQGGVRGPTLSFDNVVNAPGDGYETVRFESPILTASGAVFIGQVAVLRVGAPFINAPLFAITSWSAIFDSNVKIGGFLSVAGSIRETVSDPIHINATGFQRLVPGLAGGPTLIAPGFMFGSGIVNGDSVQGSLDIPRGHVISQINFSVNGDPVQALTCRLWEMPSTGVPNMVATANSTVGVGNQTVSLTGLSTTIVAGTSYALEVVIPATGGAAGLVFYSAEVSHSRP